MEQTYLNGVLPPGFVQKARSACFFDKGNVESTVDQDQFIKIETLQESVDQLLKKTAYPNYSVAYYKLFLKLFCPTLPWMKKFTSNAVNQSLGDISPYWGLVKKNSIIIKQGEVVEGKIPNVDLPQR